MRETRRALPIVKIKDALTEALRTNQVVVVSGGTGSGKSTQCPQYILESAIANGLGPETRIVVTQPRRIAAVSVAQRVANERGEKAGNSVGFSVRLHGTSPRDEGASVEFVTTGVLLRRLMRDPALKGVSHVMIDEVHERDINTDFLLVLLRAGAPARTRVVLMSATLDAESFSEYFARSTDLKGVKGLEFDSGGESALASGSASSAAPPPAPLLSVPTKPRHPVETLYLEHLAGEADEDEDAVATDDVASSSRDPSSSAAMEGIGAKLASALLEAQDELLERELEEAVAEERAADAFDSEACADGDAERATCPVTRPETPKRPRKRPRTSPSSSAWRWRWRAAASRERPRRARSVGKARQPRAHAPARRRDAPRRRRRRLPGGRAVVSRAAGLAVRKQRAGPSRGAAAPPASASARNWWWLWRLRWRARWRCGNFRGAVRLGARVPARLGRDQSDHEDFGGSSRRRARRDARHPAALAGAAGGAADGFRPRAERHGEGDSVHEHRGELRDHRRRARGGGLRLGARDELQPRKRDERHGHDGHLPRLRHATRGRAGRVAPGVCYRLYCAPCSRRCRSARPPRFKGPRWRRRVYKHAP